MMNFYQQRLCHFRNLGFYPKVIYDIGACQGKWTEETESVFPDSAYYLFEANEKHTHLLKKQRHPFFIVLLGDQEKPSTFYATKIKEFGTGDSILRENSDVYSDKNCQEIVLQMTTLSAMVQKHQLPKPDLIKIDVQGAEKLVIQGGLDIVSSAEAMILESQISQYNQGAPLAAELIRFMDSLSFQIVDVVEAAYSQQGDLIHLDFLFLKKNSRIIRSLF
jgi:FkbM family methyltransferase